MKEGGLGGNSCSPMDIFDMFFSGGPFGGGGRRRREHKGKDVVHQLSVSLEDLYKGATRKLALEKNVICDKCEGNLFLRFYYFNDFTTSTIILVTLCIHQ